MGKLIDLTGERFGNLTVIERGEVTASPSGARRTHWLCKCDCGNYKEVVSLDLRKGHTQSCGCLHNKLFGEISRRTWTTHAGSKDRLFSIWHDMNGRCKNKNHSQFKNYGGRGIKVCDRWANSYENFREDALNAGYDETAKRGECTIDRIDVNGDYAPNNVRWVSTKIQNNNTRRNHMITYKGKTQTLAQWAEEIGIKDSTLLERLRRGWSIENAIEKPLGYRPRT